MKIDKPKSLLFLVFIWIAAVLPIVIIVGLFAGQVNDNSKELFPREVVQSVKSPNGKTTALLLSGKTDGYLDFLGSDKRYYLGLQRNNATYIIDRELTEGFGDDKGGVPNIKWLNDQEVLVERTIGGQRKDIVFDLSTHEWMEYKSKK